MKTQTKILLLFCFIPLISFSQSFTDWDDYSVEQFYKKMELDNDVLDEDGDEIDFIFIPTDLDEGVYEVEIADGPGDLYEIKGTDYYCTFRGYYGYAGYGDEGILKVESSSYYSTFYKKE